MNEARELNFDNHEHLEDTDEIFLEDVDEVGDEDEKFDPNSLLSRNDDEEEMA